MSHYEYKVVPAPIKGIKAKGLKTAQDRFANALETAMNAMGAEGWEYQRADTLPSVERSGLTGKTTTFQHMLVFRRMLPQTTATPAEMLPPPEVDEPNHIDDAEPTKSVQERTQQALTPDAEATAADELPKLEARPLEDGVARKEPQVAAE